MIALKRRPPAIHSAAASVFEGMRAVEKELAGRYSLTRLIQILIFLPHRFFTAHARWREPLEQVAAVDLFCGRGRGSQSSCTSPASRATPRPARASRHCRSRSRRG